MITRLAKYRSTAVFIYCSFTIAALCIMTFVAPKAVVQATMESPSNSSYRVIDSVTEWTGYEISHHPIIVMVFASFAVPLLVGGLAGVNILTTLASKLDYARGFRLTERQACAVLILFGVGIVVGSILGIRQRLAVERAAWVEQNVASDVQVLEVSYIPLATPPGTIERPISFVTPREEVVTAYVPSHRLSDDRHIELFYYRPSGQVLGISL